MRSLGFLDVSDDGAGCREQAGCKPRLRCDFRGLTKPTPPWQEVA
jgi:hypothetical protein